MAWLAGAHILPCSRDQVAYRASGPPIGVWTARAVLPSGQPPQNTCLARAHANRVGAGYSCSQLIECSRIRGSTASQEPWSAHHSSRNESMSMTGRWELFLHRKMICPALSISLDLIAYGKLLVTQARHLCWSSVAVLPLQELQIGSDNRARLY